MKWLAKRGGQLLALTFIAWGAAVHIRALLAGDPLPALAWFQGKAQQYGPKADPVVQRGEDLAGKGLDKASGAVANADPGAFHMTDGWWVLTIVVVVLLLVWVVQRASRPDAKGKGKSGR